MNPPNLQRDVALLPRVAILLPVYNESRFIEKCLSTILSQDYPLDLLDVLVLDGRSTDDTRELVQAVAREHPQIRLLDNPARFQAAAFNLGVRESTAEIVIRMDAHAEYRPTYVRRCVETLQQTGAANAGGMWETRPGGTGLIARAIARATTMRFGIGGARFRTGGQPGPVDTVPFGAFPRSTFQKVGLMDERLVRGEDNEFNSRIRAAGLTVYFNPEIVCTYFGRSHVGPFLKQLYGNGLYHILTLIVNRSGCSLRHFVPFVFVMGLLVAGAGGFLWWPLWLIGGVCLGFYLLVDLVVSAGAAVGEDWKFCLVLPWLFPLVHVTYGLGTLIGIFYFGIPWLFGKRAH
jgi:succinoglycan biosynthesis protein ExoA